MKKKVLAVVLGIVSSMIITYIVEAIGHFVYPMPEIDLNNPEAVAEIIAKAPFGALLFVIIAWGMGALIAGIVNALVTKTDKWVTAIVIGSVLTSFGIINMIMIPHPLWMKISGFLVFIPLTLLGTFLIKPKNS